jgi:lambda repressor-like predicted transcriptional regulator
MQVRQTIITKVDLVKLLKNAGMSLNQLSRLSKVDLSTLSKAKNGHIILSEESWNKIKFFI